VGVSDPWAFGYQRFGNDKLPDHLLSVAKHRANQAITGLDREGIFNMHTDATTIAWLDRAVHAGTAIEIFCKYVLASVSPMLLLKPQQNQGIDVVLHAAGRSDLSKDKHALELVSRDASDCVLIVAQLSGRTAGVAALTDTEVGALMSVLKMRNQAIHLGMIQRVDLVKVLVDFIPAMIRLVEIAKLDPSTFWTRDPQAVLASISQNVSLSAAVAGRLSSAREFIAGRELPKEPSRVGLKGEGDVPEGFPVPGSPYSCWRVVKCYACQQDGIVWGNDRVANMRTYREDEHDPDSEIFEKELMSWPIGFACSFCNLKLSQPEVVELGLVEPDLSATWHVATVPMSFREIERYEKTRYDGVY